jgi:hypothetical protein
LPAHQAWADEIAKVLAFLAELSQPEIKGLGKINENKPGNQKVSTTF